MAIVIFFRSFFKIFVTPFIYHKTNDYAKA